jgi:hypothetical protein
MEREQTVAEAASPCSSGPLPFLVGSTLLFVGWMVTFTAAMTVVDCLLDTYGVSSSTMMLPSIPGWMVHS